MLTPSLTFDDCTENWHTGYSWPVERSHQFRFVFELRRTDRRTDGQDP